MRSRTVRCFAVFALALLATARPAAAGMIILNPNDFTSLGTFAGGYSYVVPQ
jgi:hypothetical protein